MSVVTALLNNGALLLLLLIQMAPEFIKAALRCHSFPALSTQLIPREQQILHVTGKSTAFAASYWEKKKN